MVLKKILSVLVAGVILSCGVNPMIASSEEKKVGSTDFLIESSYQAVSDVALLLKGKRLLNYGESDDLKKIRSIDNKILNSTLNLGGDPEIGFFLNLYMASNSLKLDFLSDSQLIHFVAYAMYSRQDEKFYMDTLETQKVLDSQIYDMIFSRVNIINGDANDDKKTNVMDLIAFKKFFIETKEFSSQSKLNMDALDDGEINLKDFISIKNQILLK